VRKLGHVLLELRYVRRSLGVEKRLHEWSTAAGAVAVHEEQLEGFAEKPLRGKTTMTAAGDATGRTRQWHSCLAYRASPTSSHKVEQDDGLYLKEHGEERLESVW
jgi:hypothetical protein